MHSPKPTREDTWTACRRTLEPRLAHSSLIAVPLKVIEWAIARGVTERLFAWLSHDQLIVSNRPWDARRARKLVVIPQPNTVELRFYLDSILTERLEVEPADMVNALDQWLAKDLHPSGT
jgi:hypothetical protein